MKYLILLIALIPFWANAKRDDNFLVNSKILKANNLKLYPFRAEDFHIMPLVHDETTDQLTAIGEEGLQPIIRITGAPKQNVDMQTCGDKQEMRYPWARPGNVHPSGSFFVIGKNVKNVSIKWTWAQEIKNAKAPKCALHDGYKTITYSEANVQGLKKNIFFADTGTAAFAQFKKKVYAYERSKAPNKKFPAQPHCKGPEQSYQKIGYVEKEDCKIFLEGGLGCDEKLRTGDIAGSLSKPFGLLEISQGKELEKWLIFEANGPEGQAYLGVKLINDEPSPDKEDRHFYVYSGC